MQGVSFLSILTWCFFLIAVIGAMILTTLHSPRVRKNRSVILSVTLSCLFLGTLSITTPLIIRKLHPDESRLISLDQLPLTRWVEPLENPRNDVPPEETVWTEKTPYKFKYKLQFPFQFKRWVTAFGHSLVMIDDTGSLRGFDAYSGLNHWSIETGIEQWLDGFQNQKRLYVLDRSTGNPGLRISSIDLQSTSVIWQRTLPGSDVGALAFDATSQVMAVSAGERGVWALQSKTGEIFWKRPEVFSTVSASHAGAYWMAFEPAVKGKPPLWIWMNDQSGKTASQEVFGLPSLERLISTETDVYAWGSVEGDDQKPTLVFQRLQKPELNVAWKFQADAAVDLTDVMITPSRPHLGERLILVYSKRIECRDPRNGELLWEQTFPDVEQMWAALSTDGRSIVIPFGAQEFSWVDLATGVTQFSGKLTDRVDGATFFGDWFFIWTERSLWAFQKK